MRRLARLIACAAAVLAGGFALPGATASAAPSLYWGANIGDHLTGGAPPYDMAAADQFEAMAGKRMSLIEFSLPWAHCYETPCTYKSFPTVQMEAIRARGSIPVFGWASYSQPLSPKQPDYELSEIIAGRHDAFIRQWARDAKAWGKPFFLVFNWEMNLYTPWPYLEAINNNKPGEYARAWRHVHDIFREEGATNATWTWCANGVYDEPSSRLAGLYPGDEYVDWACIDIYKWPWVGESFVDMTSLTYDIVQSVAPDKPILIGETAGTEDKVNKAAWLTEMLRDLPTRLPNVKGFVWFEKAEPALAPYDPRGWLIESTDSSLAAFRAGIASPVYAGADFGVVSSPIPPLTPVVRRTTTTPGDTEDDGGPTENCLSPARRGTAPCRRGAIVSSLSVKPRIRRTLRQSGPVAVDGAPVKFKVLADGTITIRFQRWSRKRWHTIGATTTLQMTRGLKAFTFSGRVGNRAVPAGRYRLLAGGRDTALRTARTVRSKPFALYRPR
ncbi:MAG: glycosyl hydrolase [Baekduia sp.]